VRGSVRSAGASGIAGNQQFFVGGNDVCRQGRSVGGDGAFRAGGHLVPIAIEAEADPFQALADLSADGRSVLADAAREYNGAGAAHDGEKCADVFANAIAEDIDGEASAVIVVEGDLFQGITR